MTMHESPGETDRNLAIEFLNISRGSFMLISQMHRFARKVACLIPIFASLTGIAGAQSRFHLIEATIGGIHVELRAGRLSCTQLVQAYLNRIAAYDQAGPTLNAVQNVNPDALKQAAQLDAQRKVVGDG